MSKPSLWFVILVLPTDKLLVLFLLCELLRCNFNFNWIMRNVSNILPYDTASHTLLFAKIYWKSQNFVGSVTYLMNFTRDFGISNKF